MAFLAPALPWVAAIGTAVSAYGQYSAGQAGKRAGYANAQKSEREAIERERIARLDLRRLLSTQRAGYAKGGVGGLTPLMVMAETELLGEQDIEAIRATGAETAAQERAAGNRASTAGTIGAGSTLLTGLSSTGLDYYSRKRTP